jgi:16S rRNA (cytosine967-C5)-methyltransferase
VTSRELALAVARDVFPSGSRDGRARGAHESFDYRARRSQLDARDRAFAAELAYGSIKARRYLDWILAPYVGKRAQSLPPTIMEALRLGAYQITRMAVPARAAVSETTGVAKRYGHRGTAGLVNAVLRRIAEQDERTRMPSREAFDSSDDYLGTLYSFPTWIVSAARDAFGDELLEPILRGMNEAPQRALRVNLLRATPEKAAEELHARPSPLVYEILLPGDGGNTVLEDPELRWEPQGEIAAVPVDLLDPKPGEHGVELCSGRGNKTLQIVARTRDTGKLETFERDAHRVAQARARLSSLDAQSVEVCEADARTAGGEANAAFVLLDAPCSGLGILGRQPEARWRKAPSDPARLSALQKELLHAAAVRVKSAGRLAYSVCTFESREGSRQIADFLREHQDFSRAAIPSRYAGWQTANGDLLFPPGIDRRDGFFIALLERKKQ